MPILCFASPKGGVGKTTLAANVAGRLAQTGQQTVALDLDPQNSLRLHFGIPLGDTAGYTCQLPQRPSWRRAQQKTGVGVSVLAFGRTDLATAVELGAEIGRNPELLTEPIRQMRIDSDAWLVVDTPPGPSSQLSALLPTVDLLITVLLADPASIAQIPAIESGASYGETLLQQGDQRLAFVINQFDPRTRLATRIRDGAAMHFGNRLLGVVYRDENVAEAAAAQKLISEYTPSSKAAQDIGAVSRAILERVRSFVTPKSTVATYV
jgi:cellulose synthase operon protein YhjQ